MLGTKSCGGDKTESKTGLPGSSVFWGMETGWQVMKHCKVWGSTVTQGTKVRLLGIKVRPDGRSKSYPEEGPKRVPNGERQKTV